MSLRNVTRWRFQHVNRDGDVLWESDWQGNNVTDEGEAWILDAALRANQLTGLTGFEVVLSTASSLLETSVFADVAELPDVNGYTAKSIGRDTASWSAPTGTTPTYVTTPASGTHDFIAAGGAWSTVNYACVVTVGLATNRLIAFVALSIPRTLADGDTLKVTVDLQGSGT